MTTKAEVLASLAAAYDAWQSALNVFERLESGTPGAVGEWSIQDTVAHVTWVASETAGMLEARAPVGSLALWQLPEDERNARVVAMHAGRDLADLLADSAHVHQKLIDILDSIQETDLLHAEWFALLPGSLPPWRVLQVNVTDHYLHHAADLNALAGTARDRS